MKRFTKQLLTGVVALGLLAPVATSSISSVQTTVQAKSRWHRGVPRTLKHYRSYIDHMRHGFGGYYKSVLTFGNSGADGFNKIYTRHSHHYYHNSSNDGCGWGDWWHPHYKYVGHHTWKIHEGNDGENHWTIKTHGYKHISVWNGKYIGYYHGLRYLPR